MLGEHRDVLAPVAQGRRGDGDDVEPVEEILAEALVPHELRQVLVGGGDDAHVHAQRARAPHALELALLQHAENLRLGDGREIGDLVEEERSAVGQLETPLLAVPCPREGALLVAEELGLEQGLGQGRAVDGHEGPLPARRAVVDGAGGQLLAGPALALDEHAGRAVGHLPDEGHHLLEGIADPDGIALAQKVVEALLEGAVLLDERAPLESLADHAHELRALQGLGQEVDGAVLHGAHGLLHGAEGREEDDVHVGGRLARLLQKLQPREARHLQIREEQVDAALAQPVEGGLAVGRQHHAIALAGERALETLAHRGIVVGHQQHRLIGHPLIRHPVPS